jgi:hypothetical protein
MEKKALLSDCTKYRYWLSRIWQPEKPILSFIMLNPSTADAYTDDPTIRRCISFAGGYGYGGIQVLNLFAFRATNPNELKVTNDPIGPDNEAILYDRCINTSIVFAWGTKGTLMDQDKKVLILLKDFPNIFCLKRTKAGHPQHPLYIPSNVNLSPWNKPH